MKSSFFYLVFDFFLGGIAVCIMMDKEKEERTFRQNDGHSERQFYIDINYYYLDELTFVHYYIHMNMHWNWLYLC